ncbi:MAG: UDP-N-acetylglucosamine--N-acetylmuramyl-(pentapeptide) pyrophosphoryl-undecaprenol N-acetylglucosamine transferase [Oligosphaeraceae bacterium]
MPHLIICSGGTGGHFYPALALAREYSLRGGQVTLLLSGQQVEAQRELVARHGLACREIPSVRAPRSLSQLLLFPFRFLSCARKIRKLFRELKGDALLSMGSFTSVAPCFCWPRRTPPLFLHEGNTYMGQANRLFAKKAALILLTLPLAHPRQLKGTPARVVGMPLRETLLEAAQNPPSPQERDALLQSFGLLPGRKTLLVFGGSQGAQAIVRLLHDTLPLLAPLGRQIQLICLTGSEDNAALEEACRAAGVPAHIRKADNQIQRCYQAADAVLCRAGASSLCELALFRKTAFLIPLPSAKDNHQYWNAKTLADHQAALLLPQGETTPKKLQGVLQRWLQEPEAFQEYARRIGDFAQPQATAQAIDALENAMAPAPRP